MEMMSPFIILRVGILTGSCRKHEDRVSRLDGEAGGHMGVREANEIAY
jgi:hypothetical protein